MKNKLFLNMSTSMIAQFIAVIYGFILPRLLLERFGSEVNGLTQSIKQFLGIIGFLELGIGQVIRSALYGPLAEKDNDRISCIMVSGRKFYRRMAYILTAYVVLLAVSYPHLVNQGFGWGYTTLLIATMAISSFSQYYFGIINEQLIHADQRGYILSCIQILTHVLNVIVCVYMIQKGCSIHAVKLMTSMVYLLRPVIIWRYIRNKYQINWNVRYSVEPIAQKWNGIAQHISAVVLDGTDTIVLSVFSTLANVSVYSVYYMVIGSIQQFYQAATVGLQSAVGALWASKDRETQIQLFSCIQTGLHFTTVFLFSCMGMLIVPFVQVYTEGLSDAAYTQPIFAVLLVTAYGIRCLRTPYNIWILAAGHYKQTQKCHITAAVLNLGFSVMAVFQWGLAGVAIGTLIAMIYQTGWMALYNTNNLLKWPKRDILKQFLVDMLTIILICLCCRRITMQEATYLGWFLMALKVALIAGSTTLIMSMIFYRTQIKRILKSIMRKV